MRAPPTPPQRHWHHAKRKRPTGASAADQGVRPTNAAGFASCGLRLGGGGGHVNAADVLRIAEAATVAVGGNHFHAAAADFLHDAQGALARGFPRPSPAKGGLPPRSAPPPPVFSVPLLPPRKNLPAGGAPKCPGAKKK